jgi:four helix bundle protein
VFDPEKMATYRLAREHSRAVHALLADADTRGHSESVAQLRSSTISVPANLLEATGEWRSRKRGHYLRIAKGSLMESWAHVDALVDFGVLSKQESGEVRDLQRQLYALMTTAILRLEDDTP